MKNLTQLSDSFVIAKLHDCIIVASDHMQVQSLLSPTSSITTPLFHYHEHGGVFPKENTHHDKHENMYCTYQ